MEKKWKYPTHYWDKSTGKVKKLRLYSTWANMWNRCNLPSHKSFKWYGGRGITVCEEWKSYDNFHEWAMENGYSEDMTLDRVNSSGNYSPDNCRWVDTKTQSINKRSTVYIEGECAKDFSKKLDLSYGGVLYRAHNGISLDAPVNFNIITCEGMTLAEISKQYSIDIVTVRGRWEQGYRTLSELTRPLGERVSEYNKPILIEGIPIREIGKQYNIPYQTLIDRYHRGKTTLQDIIKRGR